MIKMIAGALVGVLIIALGIFVWYIYITTFVESGNHSLFALSMIQIGVGIYILFRASKSAEAPVTDGVIRPLTPEKAEDVLERNKNLMQEYDKNTVFKDKLKMVSTAVDEWEKPKHFE